MSGIGPQLPPHLAKRKRSTDDTTTLNPPSPPTKIRATSRDADVQPRRVLGPSLPPPPQNEEEIGLDDSSDDDSGPMPPPEPKPRRVMGPAAPPPASANNDEIPLDDSSDDDVGPSLPPSTTASLTTAGHVYTAPLGVSSTFDFRNVSAGSYLLDVVGGTHVFAPLRVDVSEAVGGGQEVVKAWGTWRGNEWENRGEVVEVGVWGREGRVVEVKAVGGKEFLIERTGFSPLSILKNPMILMAGVAMLMMFGMPKLMENMDPETRAEFEERQKSSPMNGLLSGQAAQGGAGSFDAAAWLAGAPAKKQGQVAEKGVTR